MLVEILPINDTCHMIHMIHINVSNDTEIPIIYWVCLGLPNHHILQPLHELLSLLVRGLGSNSKPLGKSSHLWSKVQPPLEQGPATSGAQKHCKNRGLKLCKNKLQPPLEQTPATSGAKSRPLWGIYSIHGPAMMMLQQLQDVGREQT